MSLRLSNWLKLSPFLLVAGLAFLLSRCGTNSSTPTPGTFTAVYQNTLGSASCTQCHVSGGANNGSKLDFSTQANAYSTLNPGIATVSGSVAAAGACKSAVLVAKNSPNNSYLLAVIVSDYATLNGATNNVGVTGCTPYSLAQHNVNVSAAEEASIVQWIQAGAPNN